LPWCSSALKIPIVPTVGTNTGFSAVQTYNYDSLNRLKDATEMLTPHGGSATQSWKQTFTFDRYGNRNFDEANTAFAGFDKLCNNNTELCADLRKRLNPSINASNNRLSTSDDYAFDESGNTTYAAQINYEYDSASRMIKTDRNEAYEMTIAHDGAGRTRRSRVPLSDCQRWTAFHRALLRTCYRPQDFLTDQRRAGAISGGSIRTEVSYG